MKINPAVLMVALALAATACGPATETPKAPIASGEWREFEGSWRAAGSRRTILDAQRGYILTEIDYLQILAAYWTAVFQLEQAVGTTFLP